MIYKAKDLSSDQKAAIESLLGRRILEDEAISIRTLRATRFPTSVEGKSPNWGGTRPNAGAPRKPGTPEQEEKRRKAREYRRLRRAVGKN